MRMLTEFEHEELLRARRERDRLLVEQTEFHALLDRMAMEIHNIRHDVHVAATGGTEVWYWQGDGYDVPETLTCAVVMPAAVLRKLLDNQFPALDRRFSCQPTHTYCHRCKNGPLCDMGKAEN